MFTTVREGGHISLKFSLRYGTKWKWMEWNGNFSISKLFSPVSSVNSSALFNYREAELGVSFCWK